MRDDVRTTMVVRAKMVESVEFARGCDRLDNGKGFACLLRSKILYFRKGKALDRPPHLWPKNTPCSVFFRSKELPRSGEQKKKTIAKKRSHPLLDVNNALYGTRGRLMELNFSAPTQRLDFLFWFSGETP